jgi:hypothetical protein
LEVPAIAELKDRAVRFCADRDVRMVFWFCLPALLIGAILRITLLVQMPFGYFQSDTPDFLHTVYKWQTSQKFEMHAKKTFLVPLAYAAPFVLHLPALRVIPILQHAIGLVLIGMIGALCRLWFKHWKWFIIPATLVAAVHPSVLWYEHTLMAEALFLDCTVLVALAGTIFARLRSWGAFAFLVPVLVIEAGARPEGKLFFCFGLLLVTLVWWRSRRKLAIALGTLALVGILTHSVTKMSQAGLLLYTSVVHMTPSEMKSAPGLEPFIQPIRQEMIDRWKVHPSFPKANDRSTVAHAVGAYLESLDGRRRRNREVNEFCSRLAAETCRRNLARLPMHAFHKFRYYAIDMTSSDFNQFWLWDKQLDAYEGDMKLVSKVSRGLFGWEMTSVEEVRAFVKTNFDPTRLAWFNQLHRNWHRAITHFRLPDTRYPGYIERGIPIYFIAGALGVLALAMRPGKLWPFHFSWAGMILGLLFVIVLTANVKARFRFVFEPFIYLYILALIDCAWSGIERLIRRTPTA